MICVSALVLVALTRADPVSQSDRESAIAVEKAAASAAASNASMPKSLVSGNATANGTGNAATFVRADSPETARALGSLPKQTEVRDSVAECYVCDSYKDVVNKCRDLSKVEKRKCNPNQHACHYIVGEVLQNGQKMTVVLAGCDVAPATKLPMIAAPVTHTASDGKMECRDFVFVHEDIGSGPIGSSTGTGAVYSDINVSFKGRTCSCDATLGCNREYTKLLPTETVVVDDVPKVIPIDNTPINKPNSAGNTVLSSGLFLAALSWMFVGRQF